MSYQPPDLRLSSINVFSAAAGVQSTQTLIGTPGAGRRLRVWAAGLSLFGATKTAGALVVMVGQVLRPALMVAYGQSTSDSVSFPGGFPFPTDTPWLINLESSIASQSVWIWAAYTIEAV